MANLIPRILNAKHVLMLREIEPERLELSAADMREVSPVGPLVGSRGGYMSFLGLAVYLGEKTRVGGRRAHRKLEMAWLEWIEA